VQWSEVGGGFKFRKHLRCDFLVLGQSWAAVDDAVPDAGRSGQIVLLELICDQLKSVGLGVNGVGLVVEGFFVGRFE